MFFFVYWSLIRTAVDFSYVYCFSFLLLIVYRVYCRIYKDRAVGGPPSTKVVKEEDEK